MRAGTIALALWLGALPAQATEWVYCSSTSEGATIGLLMGQMPVVAVNTIEMEAGGKKWSTKGGDGVTTITLGQAFENNDMLSVDVTDDSVSKVIARLRIIKASEGDAYAAGGYLHISGVGAWAVSCEGP